MASLSEGHSKRRQIVEQWMQGYKVWTPSCCSAYRVPDCVHHVVGVAPPPPWSNSDTDFFFEQWAGVGKSGHFEVHDWLESEADNKVAAYFTLTMTWQDELELPPYTGIYMIIFYFNEVQTNFVKIVEFIDTGNTHNILRAVNEGRQKLGKGPLEYPAGIQAATA